MSDWIRFQQYLTRIRRLSESSDLDIADDTAFANLRISERTMRDLHSSLLELSHLRKELGLHSDDDAFVVSLFNDLMGCANEADRLSHSLSSLSKDLEISRVACTCKYWLVGNAS